MQDSVLHLFFLSFFFFKKKKKGVKKGAWSHPLEEWSREEEMGQTTCELDMPRAAVQTT